MLDWSGLNQHQNSCVIVGSTAVGDLTPPSLRQCNGNDLGIAK